MQIYGFARFTCCASLILQRLATRFSGGGVREGEDARNGVDVSQAAWVGWTCADHSGSRVESVFMYVLRGWF